MVVLTIIAPLNEHTVQFEQPIEKPTYIRLLSHSLYNSWYNLKNPGTVILIETGAGKELKSGKLPAEHFGKTTEHRVRKSVGNQSKCCKESIRWSPSNLQS